MNEIKLRQRRRGENCVNSRELLFVSDPITDKTMEMEDKAIRILIEKVILWLAEKCEQSEIIDSR